MTENRPRNSVSTSRPMAGTKSVDAKDAEKGKKGRKGERERVKKQGQ